MNERTFRLSAVAAVFAGVLVCSPVQAQGGGSAAIEAALPQASGGECYSRVSVPAVYRKESVDVVRQEAGEEFKITEARFRSTMMPVEVRPAYEKLTAIQPEMEEITETIEVAPARTLWVRGDLDSNAPLSAGEKADLEAAGVDLEATEPGSCYFEHLRPAILKDATQRVLVSEATEELKVIPASFKEATREVEVKAAHKSMKAVPPVYGEREERILISPATMVWKPGSGPIQRIDNTTGEIMCLVEVPAQYETVTTKVVTTPGSVEMVSVPAKTQSIKIEALESPAQRGRRPIPEKYEDIDVSTEASPASYSWLEVERGNPAGDGKPTGRVACLKAEEARTVEYTRQVVKTPGRFEVESVPAKTEEIAVEALATDAVSSPVSVPAVTDTIERIIKISDARMEWQPVLCETNMTTDVITNLQRALKREGYNPGPIDGVLGKGTDRAVAAYQRDKNIAAGGLTIELLQALGVKL